MPNSSRERPLEHDRGPASHESPCILNSATSTGAVRESIHIASTHHAFDTRIFHKECKTLAKSGRPVTLIVPHERDELVDGIRIKAVPVPPDGKTRLSTTLWQLLRAAMEESKEAIYHFHDSELLPAMLWLKASGRRVVYDMHEDTPLQVMYQHWIPARLRTPVSLVMQGLEWVGSRVFDGLIAAEPEIAERFPGRAVVVHNFPILAELGADDAVPYEDRPPHIAYVGTITRVRGIEELAQAMALLPETLGAQLILGGSFHPSTLEAEMQRHPGWRRVDVRGWMRRPQVRSVLGRVRAGIVVLHPTEKYLQAYPTKLFEYMAAGLPVIASDFPVWRRFVEEAECGLLVDPQDPADIAKAITWLLTHPEEAQAMGARGQAAVQQEYNWGHEAEKLLAFYHRLDSR